MPDPTMTWRDIASVIGGLGKDPERAQRRAEQLAAIDPDWNPGALGWTVDGQRHYIGLAALLAGGADLEEIMPGVTHRGDNIGRWLTRQTRDWAQLNEEQQQRLAALGVKPVARPQKTAAQTNAKAGAAKGSDAFTRGVAALRQYIQREGKTVVGRQHVEELPDGSSVRLGVFLSNQKSCRDRLTEAQLAALAELGYHWA